MSRKLATFRVITELLQIDGADRIELAVLDGWQVIVQKGKYQVGQIVVYLEIDSWVPTELAPFLTKEGRTPKTFNGVSGERLKSMRMKGVLSQGLVIDIPSKVLELEIDADLTDTLGIQLWEQPQGGPNNNGLGYNTNRNWPIFLQKTDQERIQNCFNDVRRHQLTQPHLDAWEVTEKLDGSSMTVYFSADGAEESGGHLGVCSRNCELELDIGEDGHAKSRYWRTALELNLPAALEEYCRAKNLQLAIQGELIGPGIQGNKYLLDHYQFRVYDVYDINRRGYLGAEQRRKVVNELGLQHVPSLGVMRAAEFKTVDDLLTFAEGSSELAMGIEREGVVFKNIFNPQFSFKAISNKFLLKHGD